MCYNGTGSPLLPNASPPSLSLSIKTADQIVQSVTPIQNQESSPRSDRDLKRKDTVLLDNERGFKKSRREQEKEADIEKRTKSCSKTYKEKPRSKHAQDPVSQHARNLDELEKNTLSKMGGKRRNSSQHTGTSEGLSSSDMQSSSQSGRPEVSNTFYWWSILSRAKVFVRSEPPPVNLQSQLDEIFELDHLRCKKKRIIHHR
ncbi:MAG: hypothetical protein L6R41_003975 [Letrouitia leprolyta]|nr:MAG: hypothetical protein L6R41_003975 [Letrouitia leprolyta]